MSIDAGIGLVLSLPKAGILYEQREVAEMMLVSIATIGRWARAGKKVGNRTLRLPILKRPRGKISPRGLAAFLADVNRIGVAYGKHEIWPVKGAH